MATKTRRLTLDEILTTPVSKRGLVAPRIVCKDGTSLSVQATQYAYCEPRDDVGPWTKVEVGYPDAQPEPTWVRYRNGDDWRGIYAWVPVELVREHIKIHGGEAK